MLNILCVCHNGMGISMLLKINVNNICMDHGISANIDACAHGEAAGFLMSTDIVLTDTSIIPLLPPTDAKVIGVINLMDKADVEEKLLACIKENFPGEL
ncbi:MAG: PTS sugar transporter subunit IIB [Clostridiales bacterium]|nr:PTS sugar transporter subunit IIB [Clostridiales bacterium]